MIMKINWKQLIIQIVQIVIAAVAAGAGMATTTHVLS